VRKILDTTNYLNGEVQWEEILDIFEMNMVKLGQEKYLKKLATPNKL
jgi:hypothetical protein